MSSEWRVYDRVDCLREKFYLSQDGATKVEFFLTQIIDFVKPCPMHSPWPISHSGSYLSPLVKSPSICFKNRTGDQCSAFSPCSHGRVEANNRGQIDGQLLLAQRQWQDLVSHKLAFLASQAAEKAEAARDCGHSRVCNTDRTRARFR